MALLMALAPGFAPAEGQDGEEASGKYPEYLRKGLAERRLDIQRDFMEGPVPLSWLPEGLTYPENEVSLVPDPKTRGRDGIALYLVNTSAETIKVVRYPYSGVFQEVKQGEEWKRCEPFYPDCISGSDELRFENLEPGHALILCGVDPNFGDLEGEVRYCFDGPSAPIASAGIKGRISSKAYEEAKKDIGSFSHLMVVVSSFIGSDGKDWRKHYRMAEGLVARMELERHYDESGAIRELAGKWLADERKHARPSPECAAALRAVLNRPWDRIRDERACFRRCLDALSSKRGKKYPYGSPERCRAAVWNHLTDGKYLDDAERFINPERWAALERLKATDNPWGAEPEELAKLVKLAREAMRAGDAEEQAAARGLLLQSWITPEFFFEE